MRKKIVTMLVLACTIMGSTTMTVAASDQGGWDEEKGRFIIIQDEELYIGNSQTRASEEPDSHMGERLERTLGGKSQSAAYGETVWAGVDHYTTAQMEFRNGESKKSSGRCMNVDGSSSSTAHSGWLNFDPSTSYRAKTYWGKA